MWNPWIVNKYVYTENSTPHPAVGESQGFEGSIGSGLEFALSVFGMHFIKSIDNCGSE
jgi:hypothetical protein